MSARSRSISTAPRLAGLSRDKREPSYGSLSFSYFGFKFLIRSEVQTEVGKNGFPAFTPKLAAYYVIVKPGTGRVVEALLLEFEYDKRGSVKDTSGRVLGSGELGPNILADVFDAALSEGMPLRP